MKVKLENEKEGKEDDGVEQRASLKRNGDGEREYM